MKITEIRLERLRFELDPPFEPTWEPVPRRKFDVTIVRVHTDQGLTGIGSGDTMVGFERFEHLFVGADPLALAAHARTLETIAFHAGRYWPLEAALWDLAGKALDVPVATLLGGAATRLPAYASWGSEQRPEQRAQDALALIEQGFRAVKIRIAGDRPERGLEVVEAVRAAAGDRLDLLVDLNQWWRTPGDDGRGLDPAAARWVIQRLGESGVLWVEEPLAGADLRGMAALRAQTGVRIAGGEMARTFDELHQALSLDSLDVYQPDAVLALGISGTRTFADLALRRNRWFSPHTWSNGIGLLANLHVCCGVGGGPYVEYPYDPPQWTPARRDFMLAEPTLVDADGMLALPDRPGLGIDLDEQAISSSAVR